VKVLVPSGFFDSPLVWKLSRRWRTSTDVAAVRLLRFYLYCATSQEDGDVTEWDDGLYSRASQGPPDTAEVFRGCGVVTKRGGRELITDWLDAAGGYLCRKYSSRKERLMPIYNKYGVEPRQKPKMLGDKL